MPGCQDFALTTYASLPFLTEQTHLIFATQPRTKVGHYGRLAAELLALTLTVVAVLVVARRPALLLRAERWVVQRRRVWLLGWIAVLALLAGYAYLIRPQIITATTLQSPLAPANALQLQGYIGAPIAAPTQLNAVQRTVAELTGSRCQPTPKPGQLCDDKVANAQANLVRLGWYVSPLGVVLGVLGGLLWWWRADRRSWLLLVIATAYIVVYVRMLYGTSDATYIYILRRYVPLVFPAWMLAMSYALCGPHLRRRALQLGGAGLAALLLAFFVWTGRGVYRHIEYGGSFAQFAALAAQLQPADVVLVRTSESRDQADIPAAPLTYLYGRNALTFKGSDPLPYAAALSEQVGRWQADGRAVYLLLGADSGDWALPGYGVAPVTDWQWRYQEYEQTVDHKPSQPSGPQTFLLRLYRVVPTAAAPVPATITVLDTAYQLGGLYRAEESPEGWVAWTAAEALLRLPAPAGAQLVVEASAGVRPLPAQLCARVIADQSATRPAATDPAWHDLGCQPLAAARTALGWALPPTLAGRPLVVQLHTTPWVPAAALPASNDGRSLGVRLFQLSRQP